MKVKIERFKILLLMPIVVIVFLVGWTLYWKGDVARAARIQIFQARLLEVKA